MYNLGLAVPLLFISTHHYINGYCINWHCIFFKVFVLLLYFFSQDRFWQHYKILLSTAFLFECFMFFNIHPLFNKAIHSIIYRIDSGSMLR